MTVEEVLSHFPSEIPQKMLHEADMKRPIYLFRLNKEGDTVCGNCGSRFMASIYDRHSSSSIEECPCCRVQAARVYMPNYSHNEARNLRRTYLTYHWGVSIKNPDVLTCTVILSCYWFSSELPLESEPYRYVDARYIFVPGKGGYYISRQGKFCDRDFYGGIYFPTWNPAPHKQSFVLRKRCRDRKRVYQGKKIFIGKENNRQIEALVKGHRLEYVFEAMKHHLGYELAGVELMHIAAKYPLQVEYLAKVGFDGLIAESVKYNLGLNHVFNMKGKTLKDITRRTFSKEDMAYISKSSPRLYSIQRYQEIKKNPMGCGISLEMTMGRLLAADSMHNISCIMNHVQLIKAVRYLQKENSSIHIYADYLRDCEMLEMNFKEKATLFPKHLEKLHVRIQEQVKRKHDEEAQRKWQKRRKAVAEKYSFADGGFVIVVPDNINDLIREGKDMHNCVGSYIKRVANGETDVVYIRDANEIDKSLGTMEIHKGHIIQARGKYNHDLPDDVQKFVNRFRVEVLEKKGLKTA